MPQPDALPTILIVDDEPSILSSLRRLLRRDFTVLTAASGQAAFELIRAQPVACILADQRMPGLSGTAFLAQAAKEYPNAIRMILTGYSDMENVVAAINTGQVYRYLLKPWNPDELVATVREAAAKHTLIEHNQQLTEALLAANADLEARVQARTAELAAANSDLRRLDQLKDELLTITSHDLRSPLTSIQMAADMLAGKLDDLPRETVRSFLQDISAGARHLIELVNDLLDLARLESGQARVHAEGLLVSEVVRASVKALAYNAQAKQIGVQVEVQPDEPVLLADRLKLSQVFNNLLSNAVKFTRPGGQVQIGVAPVPGGVGVAVTDTGLGIRAEDLPRLFGKFAQTRTRATADEKGTGLGLSITKQLVELHGGRIEVASVVGVGSTFTVHLPAASHAGEGDRPAMPAAATRTDAPA
ncbi:MAG: hybrid sensor histidine kinase/response regulator [Anaerolineales bacterium]